MPVGSHVLCASYFTSDILYRKRENMFNPGCGILDDPDGPVFHSSVMSTQPRSKTRRTPGRRHAEESH